MKELLEILENDDLEKLKLFIAKKGDINQKLYDWNSGVMGKTALQLAVEREQVDIIACLLKNGAKANGHVSRNGGTILEDALSRSASLEVVKCLVENGLPINAQDIDGDTPLHIAVSKGNLAIIEYLLKQGAKLSLTNKQGETALHWAVHNLKVFEKIKLLLKNGADINAQDELGNTLLHLVSVEPGLKLSVLEYVLDYPGINIYQQNKAGETALSLAVTKKYFESMRLFLKKGAYIDMPLANGKKIKELEVAESLFKLASGDKLSSKELSEDLREIDIYRLSINGRQFKTGNTALHLAILNKQDEVVRKLLENNPNVLLKNHAGDSALTLLQKQYSTVFYLLALANACVVTQMEETLRFQKSCEMEHQEVETKESKETKVSKEIKETVEASAAHIESEMLLQCEHHLKEIEACLAKISEKQSKKFCFNLGELLSNPECCLYSPAWAYQLLSHLGEVPPGMNTDYFCFYRAQGIMLKLLISRSLIFEMGKNDETPKPCALFNELDGQSREESDKARDYRLFCIIKHILYGKSEHDDILGKYISEYIHSDTGITGLKGLQGKSVASQLALIKAFKEEVASTQQVEKEIKKVDEEINALEREIKRMEEAQNTLEGQNTVQTENGARLHFQFAETPESDNTTGLETAGCFQLKIL